MAVRSIVRMEGTLCSRRKETAKKKKDSGEDERLQTKHLFIVLYIYRIRSEAMLRGMMAVLLIFV